MPRRTVVYLRFPRRREGFVDPPIAEWNATKERELWSMLRNTSTDVEWNDLAAHFGVSPVYILQQAAWLYEKELGMLRHRMSRISVPPRGTDQRASVLPEALIASPVPGPGPSAAPAQQRSPHSVNSPSSSKMRLESPLDTLHSSGRFGSDHLDGSAGSMEHTFVGRRLLSASRAIASDEEGSASEGSSEEDGFMPLARPARSPVTTAPTAPSADDDTLSSSSLSGVSQSALEAALMEQQAETDQSEITP